jgi:hypothetical protein
MSGSVAVGPVAPAFPDAPVFPVFPAVPSDPALPHDPGDGRQPAGPPCRHLERALSVHEKLDARPLVARTKFELARALHAAGAEPSVVARPLELARKEATKLGQYGLLRWIEMFSSVRAGSHSLSGYGIK